MARRGKELAERFRAFNNELLAFVENCSDDDWKKVCPGEGWSVGVVAHHTADSHYGALGLVKMIVAGDKLPEITGEAINTGNAEHARKHAHCTRDEVLDILRANGSSTADYINGLRDEDLDRTGHLGAIGHDLSAQQFIEAVVFQSGGEHVRNMKAATGA